MRIKKIADNVSQMATTYEMPGLDPYILEKLDNFMGAQGVSPKILASINTLITHNLETD